MRPGYPAYRNILRTLGCEVVELDCGPEVRFQPTPELLEDAHAAAPLAGLILASPANPTGTMVDRVELTAITEWCAARGVRLVSDGIYHGVTYPEPGAPDPRGVCARELDASAIVISSFSKYWGMTGWRLGWMLLPEELARPVDALAGNLALCPPTPAQYAAVAAFTPESYLECEDAVAEFAATRKLLLDNAPRLGWGQAAPADGAFYHYADLGTALERWPSSAAYGTALLEEAGVALTPGSDFDDRVGSARKCRNICPMYNPSMVVEGGARVRATRKRAGLTQAELSARSGVPQPAISSIERGHGDPRPETVARLVDAARGSASDLLDKHRSEIIAIAADNGLTQVRVFGSVARREDVPGSDVDLLVTPSETTTLLDVSAAAIAMEDLLGCPVDLVVDNHLVSPTGRHIRETAIPL